MELPDGLSAGAAPTPYRLLIQLELLGVRAGDGGGGIAGTLAIPREVMAKVGVRG